MKKIENNISEGTSYGFYKILIQKIVKNIYFDFHHIHHIYIVDNAKHI